MTSPDAMVNTPLMSREPLAIAFRPKRSCSSRMISEAGSLVSEVILNITKGLNPSPSTLREMASKHSVSTILRSTERGVQPRHGVWTAVGPAPLHDSKLAAGKISVAVVSRCSGGIEN